jgi:hypothetical protein
LPQGNYPAAPNKYLTNYLTKNQKTCFSSILSATGLEEQKPPETLDAGGFQVVLDGSRWYPKINGEMNSDSVCLGSNPRSAAIRKDKI